MQGRNVQMRSWLEAGLKLAIANVHVPRDSRVRVQICCISGHWESSIFFSFSAQIRSCIVRMALICQRLCHVH